jgi:hypothetical protein
MAARSTSTHPRRARSEAAEPEDLVDYCSRPTCRKEFRRAAGPGRRQAFCSEFCRRAGERELRQARSRLAHFETVVEKLRIDVAAFGRDDDAPEAGILELRRRAHEAISRTGGALEFMSSRDEPAVRELHRLYDAVAPLFELDAD